MKHPIRLAKTRASRSRFSAGVPRRGNGLRGFPLSSGLAGNPKRFAFRRCDVGLTKAVAICHPFLVLNYEG